VRLDGGHVRAGGGEGAYGEQEEKHGGQYAPPYCPERYVRDLPCPAIASQNDVD